MGEYLRLRTRSEESATRLSQDFRGVQEVLRDRFNVGRMIVGSSSRGRIEGLTRASIFPIVEPWDMSNYNEPQGNNVLGVALDKSEHVVSEIQGKYGSPSLIVTEDVLTGQAGEVMHQMRRKGSYSWGQIQNEINHMVEILRDPSWWVWHVGVVMSVCGLRVGWGREFSIAYGSIPENLVRESFVADLPQCQSRPPRLDLLGKFAGFAQKAYSRVTTPELIHAGEDIEPHLWWPCTNEGDARLESIDVMSILECVRNGIPVKDDLGGYQVLP